MCKCPNRTSLPETSREMVNQGFNPDNLHDAYAVIRDVEKVPMRVGAVGGAGATRIRTGPIVSEDVDAFLAGLGQPASSSEVDCVSSNVAGAICMYTCFI